MSVCGEASRATEGAQTDVRELRARIAELERM